MLDYIFVVRCVNVISIGSTGFFVRNINNIGYSKIVVFRRTTFVPVWNCVRYKFSLVLLESIPSVKFS